MNVDVPNEVINALAEARALMRSRYETAIQAQSQELALALRRATAAEAKVVELERALAAAASQLGPTTPEVPGAS